MGGKRGHIWTRPVLQDSADDILGKDCEHISGLEVEGRHPRALMEFALFPLRQVNGLAAFARTAQPPISGSRKAGLTNYAIMHSSCNLMGIIKLRRGKAHLWPEAPR